MARAKHANQGGVPVAHLLGLFHAGTGLLLKLGGAPLFTHDLAQGQTVPLMVDPGEVRVADRALCSSAHLALLVQAGLPAVLRVGARQMVDFTPARPLVRPSVRRTSAVNGVPRSRWLTSLGVHAPRVAWVNPKPCPSWLTREAVAALPEPFGRREVRDHIATPGVRTHQVPRVTTRRDAEVYRVADLADRSHQRWPVETALAQLKTPRQMDVLHWKTGPGVLKALPVLALIDNRVRRVICQSVLLHHRAGERISCLDALRWLSAPHPDMPLVALSVNPARPHRVEPRVNTRRPKSVPGMLKSRQELRPHLVQHVIRGYLHAIRLPGFFGGFFSCQKWYYSEVLLASSQALSALPIVHGSRIGIGRGLTASPPYTSS
jgi:hypothetical protein